MICRTVYSMQIVFERKLRLTIKAPDDGNYMIMQERRIARIEGKIGYFKILPFFLAGEIYWLYHIDVLDTQVKTFSLDEALEILEENGWSTGFSLLDINEAKSLSYRGKKKLPRKLKKPYLS